MAITPNYQLSNDQSVVLRDYRHANLLFANDKFRLAPKNKFLFHVAFSINQAALKNINLVQRHRNEINMLVKSCDLPNYAISTETLNQYNRKKNVQFTHQLKPINIKFHDDNMGVINQLWQNYYSYYYADPTSATNPGAYNRTATQNFNYVKTPYGLDNRSTLPFFNYITIYQMARHEYVSYKLYNPIITAWNHNNVDYSQNALHDNSVTIAYEAVSYDSGNIEVGTPEGFAMEHYDLTPSPLKTGPGATSSSPSFADSKNVTSNAANFVKNLTESVNTYQNTQPLTNSGTTGIATKLVKTSTQGVSGLQGIAFPVSATASNNITASKVKLG